MAPVKGDVPAIGKKKWKAKTRATVPEDACPPVGEKKDRQLGCALAFLHAGSTKNFLAMIDGRPRI